MFNLFAFFMLAVLPAVTLPTEYAQAIVSGTGCHAAVQVITGESINGMYSDYGHTQSILIVNDGNVPQGALVSILLHETGHCLQNGRGFIDSFGSSIEREWDADRLGQDLAIEQNLEYNNAETLRYVVERLGIDPYAANNSHGRIIDRILANEYYARKSIPTVGAD